MIGIQQSHEQALYEENDGMGRIEIVKENKSMLINTGIFLQ